MNSPYIFNTVSSRQVLNEENNYYQQGYMVFLKHQILRTKLTKKCMVLVKGRHTLEESAEQSSS